MTRRQFSTPGVLALTAAGLLLAGTSAGQQHRSQRVSVTTTGSSRPVTVSPGTTRFQRVSPDTGFFFVPFGGGYPRGLAPRPSFSWYNSPGVSYPVSYGAYPGYTIVASSSRSWRSQPSGSVKPVAYESPAAGGPSTSVVLKFLLPTADAELWVEGNKVDSTGRVRQYVSPPLEPGVKYAYTVEARWLQEGRKMSQTREVPVSAGDRNSVDFAAPA